MRFLTVVLGAEGLVMVKEAGPEIFVQRKLLIVPSGSLELFPTSVTLSTGKSTRRSFPAFATGGLSIGGVFLQAKKIMHPIIETVIRRSKIFFIKRGLMVKISKIPTWTNRYNEGSHRICRNINRRVNNANDFCSNGREFDAEEPT